MNKCLHFKTFSSGLIRGGLECLCAMSQNRYLTRIILFTVKYCIFANGDVSIRFNGKDDNVVLERAMKFCRYDSLSPCKNKFGVCFSPLLNLHKCSYKVL